MRRAPLLLATGGALMLLHASSLAVPMREPQADEGLPLLERAARAAKELSFRGTQLVSFWSETGSTSALLELTHVAGEGLLLRVVPTPQNPGGAVYDDESGEVPEVVGFGKGTLDLLAAHYDIGIEGPGEVAGRRAQVVVVRRPGSSPAARFWLDKATGLPLRREVLDGAGRTLRESAFIQVSIGDAEVTSTDRTTAALMPVAQSAPLADVVALRAEGWHVPDRLASGLEMLDARLTGTGDDRTLHVTYSDGLSTVSVFQQRGFLDSGSLDGWRRAKVAGNAVWVQDAFPRRLVWGGDGAVFTVVADCPQAALDDLVGTLPHGTPGPGLATRLGNGLARVGSWLNPFA